MMDDETSRLSEAECLAELDALFSNGPAGEDVSRELAPAGWASSPLRAVAHPSVEQIHAESMALHNNLQSLRRKDDPRPPVPPPTLEDVRSRHAQAPSEPITELAELVCRCLWDVFSDNHEVVTSDNRVVDLGSFRGSAGFLADWITRSLGREDVHYDYMDFYMGTAWVHSALI